MVLKRDGRGDSTPRPACSSLANRVVLFSLMNEVRLRYATEVNELKSAIMATKGKDSASRIKSDRRKCHYFSFSIEVSLIAEIVCLKNSNPPIVVDRLSACCPEFSS
jgi:hypothetical protein